MPRPRVLIAGLLALAACAALLAACEAVTGRTADGGCDGTVWGFAAAVKPVPRPAGPAVRPAPRPAVPPAKSRPQQRRPHAGIDVDSC
ncbi:hypothetical protein [Streptomyces sp. NPDC059063]|uniref:hypothetical protein n=1 Tax=Streptomyces sp. NPDC059063 TaxID=3346712 RepID=UPI0036C93C90